jgi:hypothetical protein
LVAQQKNHFSRKQASKHTMSWSTLGFDTLPLLVLVSGVSNASFSAGRPLPVCSATRVISDFRFRPRFFGSEKGAVAQMNVFFNFLNSF